jgi:hypothetical protein
MERVIRLTSSLSLASLAGIYVTNSFLTQLWNDLEHPPLLIDNVQCVSTARFIATIVDELRKHDALTDYGVPTLFTMSGLLSITPGGNSTYQKSTGSQI